MKQIYLVKIFINKVDDVTTTSNDVRAERERDRTLTVEPESSFSTTQGVGADAVVGADVGVAERADDHPHEDLVV